MRDRALLERGAEDGHRHPLAIRAQDRVGVVRAANKHDRVGRGRDALHVREEPAEGVGVDPTAYKDAQAKDQSLSEKEAQLLQLTSLVQYQEQQVESAQAAFDEAQDALKNLGLAYHYGRLSKIPAGPAPLPKEFDDAKAVVDASRVALERAKAALAETRTQGFVLDPSTTAVTPPDGGGQVTGAAVTTP